MLLLPNSATPASLLKPFDTGLLNGVAERVNPTELLMRMFGASAGELFVADKGSTGALSDGQGVSSWRGGKWVSSPLPKPRLANARYTEK